jgi:hypothetical protein
MALFREPLTHFTPLKLVPADADQLVRLDIFRHQHPEVQVHVGGHGAFWQAVLPDETGTVIITRWLLGDLLDMMDKLCRTVEEPAPGHQS